MNKTTRRGHRPRHIPPLRKKCINLTDEQCRLLRMWGRGDLSAGLRWLIEQAKHIVHRPEDKGPQSTADVPDPPHSSG